MWVHAMDQYGDIFEEVKPRMDTVEVCIADKLNCGQDQVLGAMHFLFDRREGWLVPPGWSDRIKSLCQHGFLNRY